MVNLYQVYSFNTLAPTVLGSKFSGMKVMSIMSVKEAVKYRDVVTLQSNLANTLPLPDINTCTFILFQNINGEETVLAYEWLDPNSIVKTTTTNIKVELFNTTADDLSIITMRLKELGYTGFNISTF